MNQKDFRNIFSEIKYTEEFKAKMRQRLSEAPQNTEYSQSVEGVEHDRRSNIVRRFSAAAAACVVIAALGLAGYGMKNMLSDNDDVFTPTAAEATTLTSAEETTVPVTESPASDRRGLNFKPYTDLYGMSEEELLEIGKIYYEEAVIRLPFSYLWVSETEPPLLELDFSKTAVKDGYIDYFLITNENIKSMADIRNMFFDVFSDGTPFIDEYFMECEDGIYYSAPSGTGNLYYEDFAMELTEVTGDCIRYTVTGFYNDGISFGTSVYEEEIEFRLERSDDGWKVATTEFAHNGPFDMNAYQAEKEKQQLEKAESEKQKEAEEEAMKNIQEAIDNQKAQEEAEAQIKAAAEAMKNKEEKSTQAE